MSREAKERYEAAMHLADELLELTEKATSEAGLDGESIIVALSQCMVNVGRRHNVSEAAILSGMNQVFKVARRRGQG